MLLMIPKMWNMKIQRKMGMRTQTCNEACREFLFCIKYVYLFLTIQCLDIDMCNQKCDDVWEVFKIITGVNVKKNS